MQTSRSWDFAELDPPRLSLVREAERTLGADYVIAFRAHDGAAQPPTPPDRYTPANLDESRLECLQGLERQLDAVLVAYRQR